MNYKILSIGCLDVSKGKIHLSMELDPYNIFLHQPEIMEHV